MRGRNGKKLVVRGRARCPNVGKQRKEVSGFSRSLNSSSCSHTRRLVLEVGLPECTFQEATRFQIRPVPMLMEAEKKRTGMISLSG